MAAFQTAKGELDYTQTLPATNRPSVWVISETHCGVGAKLSYCDSLLKNKKDSVLADISMVESYTTIYPAYVGFCIHDWEGWKALSPVSTDSSYSGCVFPAGVDHYPTSSTISIYPNPTNHQISLSHLIAPSSLEMIDMKGNLIHRFAIQKDKYEFQFNGAPGMYLIKIRSEKNTEVRKVMVQ